MSAINLLLKIEHLFFLILTIIFYSASERCCYGTFCNSIDLRNCVIQVSPNALHLIEPSLLVTTRYYTEPAEPMLHLNHAFYKSNHFHLQNSFSYSLSSLSMQISCYSTLPHTHLFPHPTSFTTLPLPFSNASFTPLDKAASLEQELPFDIWQLQSQMSLLYIPYCFPHIYHYHILKVGAFVYQTDTDVLTVNFNILYG
jgi:hypothetical protein